MECKYGNNVCKQWFVVTNVYSSVKTSVIYWLLGLEIAFDYISISEIVHVFDDYIRHVF